MTDRERRSARVMRMAALGLGLLVAAVDWSSKLWVRSDGRFRYYEWIDGLLTIQYSTNDGIAFGILGSIDSPWKAPLLSAVALVAVLLVLYYIRTASPREPVLLGALGLLLGGILGNGIDRLANGWVTDFVRLHWGGRYSTPTFNLADAAITAGVLCIVLSGFFEPEDRDQMTGGIEGGTPGVN